MYHRKRTVFAHSTQGGSYPLVETQAQSATNYITNNTSHRMTMVNRGSTGVNARRGRSEEEFVERSLKNLADNGDLLHGDHVIIAHGYWNYGCGGAETHITYDGLDLHGVAVYSGAYVSDNESRHFVWHELGHIMGNEHNDGCYDIRWDNRHDEPMTDNITPMATGYVYGENGNNDVQYSTSGWDDFSHFDCGASQESDYKNDTDDFQDHHDYSYSDEAISNIDSTID